MSTDTAVRERLVSIADIASALNCKPELTGSMVICPHARNIGSDVDYLCLVPDLIKAAETLSAMGFTQGGSATTMSEKWPPPIEACMFWSMRHGELNVILTQDEQFAKRFMLATRVATKLGLALKSERVTLFQAVLYQNG